MFKKIAIAAMLAVLSAGAMAADQPYFYAGGDVGRTDFKHWQSETSVGAFGGYQINQNFAIEAGYRRLAHTSDADWDATLDQISLSGVATAPLSAGLNVFGRLGYSRMSSGFSATGVSDKGHSNEPLLGVGVGYAFSPSVMARLELQRADGQTNNLSAGVSFRF